MSETFIPPHGNYRELLSYQKAEVIYDVTFRFCQRFLSKGDRTIDQMVQAARSGKQNIAEGSRASRTSTETEIKLSLGCHAHGFAWAWHPSYTLWPKDSDEARYARKLGSAPGTT